MAGPALTGRDFRLKNGNRKTILAAACPPRQGFQLLSLPDQLSPISMTTTIRLIALSVLSASLVSCENLKNSGAGAGGSDPYVSNFGSDGGYNPYPDQPGIMSGGGAPSYEQPVAPVEADPYAFNSGGSSSAPGR